MARRGGRNKIGELNVEINADNTGLKDAVSDSEKELETLADKGEKESGRIGDAFTKLQAVVGAALGAVGIAGAILGVVNRLEEMRKKSEEASQAMSRLGTDFQRSVTQSITDSQIADPFDGLVKKAERAAAEARQVIFDQAAADEAEVRARNFFDKAIGAVSGARTLTEIREEAETAERIVNNTLERQIRNIERLRDRAREEQLQKDKAAEEERAENQRKIREKEDLDRRDRFIALVKDIENEKLLRQQAAEATAQTIEKALSGALERAAQAFSLTRIAKDARTSARALQSISQQRRGRG